MLWKCSLSFSQSKQAISLADQHLLTAINPERAGGHFYVNYVNLNSLATRDVRGAIQLSKLNGREGRKINRMKKRTRVSAPVLEDKNCLCAVTQFFLAMTLHGSLGI